MVDDNDDTRVMCRKMLRSLGVGHVDDAPDGLAATRLLNERPYDLVLADWAMPHMSGLELVQHMREQPALREVPVVLISGFFTRARVLEAAGAGVTSFLAKPFRLAALDEKVGLFLGPRELEHQPSP